MCYVLWSPLPNMPQLIYMSIMLPLLGFLSRANPHLQLIALVIPHLRNPTIRYDIGFSVGAFTKINVSCVTPFWGCCQGMMPHFQLLALVIQYSGNTKVRCDPGFSLDTFYINKCNFFYHFFYSFWEYIQGRQP